MMNGLPPPVGGYSPNQSFTQNQGYIMPQPVGGYYPYNNGYNNFNNNNNNYTNGNIESEYEYITDDEGDFVEDKNGNIYTLEEAKKRGLFKHSTGERGIKKKLLLGGGALLGGIGIIKKQLKRKKRVKKQNNNPQTPQNINNSNNTNNSVDSRENIYPFLRNSNPNAGSQAKFQYPSQIPNVYGQSIYGQSSTKQQSSPYGSPLYPNYNSQHGYTGYCYNNCNNARISIY